MRFRHVKTPALYMQCIPPPLAAGHAPHNGKVPCTGRAKLRALEYGFPPTWPQRAGCVISRVPRRPQLSSLLFLVRPLEVCSAKVGRYGACNTSGSGKFSAQQVCSQMHAENRKRCRLQTTLKSAASMPARAESGDVACMLGNAAAIACSRHRARKLFAVTYSHSKGTSA